MIIYFILNSWIIYVRFLDTFHTENESEAKCILLFATTFGFSSLGVLTISYEFRFRRFSYMNVLTISYEFRFWSSGVYLSRLFSSFWIYPAHFFMYSLTRSRRNEGVSTVEFRLGPTVWARFSLGWWRWGMYVRLPFPFKYVCPTPLPRWFVGRPLPICGDPAATSFLARGVCAPADVSDGFHLQI